ncbi:cupredoxin family protein [Roseateles asaccharophilus]|uniref:Cupredoxin-like copper-binding protein n=1 Tax=Roseateles asaccharophilus TaxID=582607 RepID=A0ABU2AAS3_9BURK|nr:cupredoxin family protein [Roseateles asaccharophilus]MDR7334269.1 putative cupredoxin-like copper-binding protein [Roseateles asaccharophilus]
MKHIITALALALAGAGAHAHGDHAASAPAAVRKEQKPWGVAGERRAAQRTVNIAMSDDMRFTPSRIEVRQGETIRLVMRNTGAVLHELVIGTQKELEAHAAQMLKFPGMEHDEPYMAHVKPGQTGEIVWTFNRAGEFDFACLIAGHFQAGMRGKFIVRAH